MLLRVGTRAPRAAAPLDDRRGPREGDQARRKTFQHPEVGTLTLDCDALTVDGSDLRLIVYTAPAGSNDADSLALLSTIGLATFSD